MGSISQTIAGITFKNPIIVASSPLTRKPIFIKRANDYGVAAVSIKHIMAEQPFRGKSRWYYQPDSKSLGICSEPRLDLEEGLDLIKWTRKETGLVILANMSGPAGSIERWGEIAKKMQNAGAHFIEINMTCPNLDAPKQVEAGSTRQQALGAAVGRDPKLAAIVTKAVKDAVTIPVCCKLTSLGANMTEVAKSCENAGADAISMTTGIPAAPRLDIFNSGKPKVAGIEGKVNFGGLGGPWTRLISNRLVAEMKQVLHVPIMGIGGIWTWQDIIESIMYGALVIQSCRALMYNGFKIIPGWIKGLESFMETTGYPDIASFSGIALKNFCAPKDMHLVPVAARVNPELCSGCERCLSIGHCEAIAMKEEKAVVNEELCVGCGLCTNVCPRSAIIMSQPALSK